MTVLNLKRLQHMEALASLVRSEFDLFCQDFSDYEFDHYDDMIDGLNEFRKGLQQLHNQAYE